MENQNPENIRQAIDLIAAVVRRIKEEAQKNKPLDTNKKGVAKAC